LLVVKAVSESHVASVKEEAVNALNSVLQ
jgi:hypothetical protein